MKNDLLEQIVSIIRLDVKKAKVKAKGQSQLDRTTASNMVDYAKLLISVERHQMNLDDAAAKAEIDADEMKELRERAAAIINKGTV